MDDTHSSERGGAFELTYTTTLPKDPGSPASLHRSECGSFNALLPDPECGNLRIVSYDPRGDVYVVSVDSKTTKVKSRRLKTSLPGRMLIGKFWGFSFWGLSFWGFFSTDWVFPRKWNKGDFWIHTETPKVSSSGTNSDSSAATSSDMVKLTFLGGDKPLNDVPLAVVERNLEGRLFVKGWRREDSISVAAWFRRIALGTYEYLSRMFERILGAS